MADSLPVGGKPLSGALGESQGEVRGEFASSEEDPLLLEELWVLDFPELAFAPSLKRGRNTDRMVARSNRDSAESPRPLRRGEESQCLSSSTPPPPPVVAAEESSSLAAKNAASRSLLHDGEDLQVRLFQPHSEQPLLLLGEEFSFKAPQTSAKRFPTSTTAVFQVCGCQSSAEDATAEAPVKSVSFPSAVEGSFSPSTGDATLRRSANLLGLAARNLSFVVDTSGQAAAALISRSPQEAEGACRASAS